MKTTGFLILNTISNICTFITLVLVLIILYYVKDYHEKIENKHRVIDRNRDKKENVVQENNLNNCSKGLIKFKRYNKSFPKSEVQEESMNNTYPYHMQEESMNNTYTPPMQETITFVPEKKNISNNEPQLYLNKCS